MHPTNRATSSQRRLLVERLERRDLLAANPFGQNPLQPLDVNRDGQVSALDALQVVNALSRAGNAAVDPSGSVGRFIDVTGDGAVTALDALRIINALNRRTPLVAATLANDTGPPNRTDLRYDLLTSEYAIDLHMAMGELASGIAELRIGSQMDFVNIADRFVGGRARLSESDVDAILGSPLSDGSHEISVRLGAEGNRIDFTLTVDRSAPVPRLSTGSLLRVAPKSIEIDFGEPIVQIESEVATLELRQADGTPLDIESSDLLESRVRLNLPQVLADGDFEVFFTGNVTDLAGNFATALTGNTFKVADPPGIKSISPANGEQHVNVRREVIVQFDEPIDPATITNETFKVFAAGQSIPGTIRVNRTQQTATFFYETPLPASTAIRVQLDGNRIIGADGLALDADGTDEPGGVMTTDFRTLPLNQIPGTELFGFVKDSQTGQPLEGVKISVDAFPEVFGISDATGFFEIGVQDLDGDGRGDGLPAPIFFAHIDGSAVTNQGGKTFASLGKPFPTTPGQREQLQKNGQTFDIFLPSVAADAITTITAGAETEVTFGASDRLLLAEMFPDVDPSMFQAMRVMIPDGAAVNDQGVVATEAFVVPVDPRFLPAPLPPNLNPALVVSIQTPGATNFDVPAAVSFPNLGGNAPGEQLLLFSFDHDKGEFVVNGTATVSADGMSVVSDPGVGIEAPGWHLMQGGSQTNGSGGGCTGGSCCVAETEACEEEEEEKEKSTFVLKVTANAAIAELEIGVGFAVAAPGLINEQGDKSILFGPAFSIENVNLIDASVSVDRDGYIASFLRNFLGTTLVSSGSVSGRAELGAMITSEIAEVAKGDNVVKIQVPGVSAASARLQFRAGGLTCKLATAFSSVNQLCGGGFEIGVSLGTRSFLPLELAILVPLPDKDGDGIPDEATEAFTAGVALDFPTFVDLGVGEHSITISLEEVSAGEGESFSNTAGLKIAGGATVANTVDPIANPSFSTARSLTSNPATYYRFFLGDSGTEIAGVTNGDGVFDTVLRPETDFNLFLYHPATNHSSVLSGTTSRSGLPTIVSTDVEFFGGIDTDGDGIPDVGEFTIGTDPTLVDTDGDGISDAAAIAQGLDPLGGRAFPTGVIASLPLPGEALEVVIAGSTENDGRLTAYVATGHAGLAIVDVSQFNDPIVVGQIDLPGSATDVDIDPQQQLAVLATGVWGLQIVDVSDPAFPQRLHAIDGNFHQVEVVNGIAYAIDGHNLMGFDLRSGELLTSAIIPGFGRVTMGRAGGRLYAFSYGSNTLSVLEPRRGQIEVLGELSDIAISDIVRVSASDDLVILGGAGFRTPNGLVTIDVSDPANMRVISGPDFFFDARGLARNGSGLVLVGSEISGVGVGIYRISDPENTNDFLLQIPTPGRVFSVAIANGIAFVAGGNTGLQVINYLPFDNQRIAPEVAIEVGDLDLDPNQPGVQVLEGSDVPVRVSVTDDVQVRNVELLVNGRVWQNAVSFPFDFVAIPPSLAGGSTTGTLQLQARAIDTGGNQTLSELLVIEVIPNAVAPSIDRFEIDSVDVDPQRPGIQIPEGRSLPVRFAASDDSGVASAELLRNGEAVFLQARSAGVFPFVTPLLEPSETSQLVELRFRATDRVGNATTSEAITLEVVPDRSPPTITASTLVDGQVRPPGLLPIRIDFSESLDPSTVNDSTFTMIGPNGTTIAPSVFQVINNARRMEANYPVLDVGAYQFRIEAAVVRDRAGNAMSNAALVTLFTVSEETLSDKPLFPSPKFSAGNFPDSVTTGDFNGDGAIDLAVANLGSGDVSVLLGNGDGTFQSEQRFVVGDRPDAIVSGDFNNDGLIDLATANEGSGDVSILLGIGDGTFQVQQRFAVGDRPRSIVTGDFNGDGVADLAIANADSSDISILLGSGDGSFTDQHRLAVFRSALAVNTGDYNGDGVIDLAFVGGNAVGVLFGNGDGTFQDPIITPVGTTQFGMSAITGESLVTGDFNQDGRADLATIDAFLGRVWILLGDGHGRFQDQQSFAAGFNAFSIAVGDFNGDGIPDLATANFSALNVSVLLGNGDGTLQDQQVYDVGLFPAFITTGDFNNDGVTDLTTANDGSGDVSILLGNGDGTFINRQREEQRRFSAGTGPAAVIISDLNGDGVADWVVANQADNDLSVRLGNGDGTFQDEQRFATGEFPQSVIAGDFNQDGIVDLAVANTFSNDVSVLLGIGDGTFGEQQRFAVGAGVHSLTSGDFDGDGIADLATANSDSNDVSILLGLGDGTFLPEQRFAAGDSPFSIITGDFNGDNVADLATTNLLSGDVSILLGMGDGNFGSEQRFTVGDGPWSIVAGDFNRDGIIDLATANDDSADISVLLGIGDGTFQDQRRFSAGDGPRSITTGDFDGDGVLDLATANDFSDGVSVLLGNGDGTFKTQQRFSVGEAPRAIASGDFNGDGLIDLITANNLSNDVSILLNQRLSRTANE